MLNHALCGCLIGLPFDQHVADLATSHRYAFVTSSDIISKKKKIPVHPATDL